MERPDLDKIEDRIKYGYGSVPFGWSTDMDAMLTYCRELEAENKRLNQELAKFDRPYTGELRS